MAQYQISDLAEIANYFRTLANDQDYCIKHMITQKAKSECKLKAQIWRDAADIIDKCEIVK